MIASSTDLNDAESVKATLREQRVDTELIRKAYNEAKEARKTMALQY